MDRPRRDSRHHNGITLRGVSQPTFATKSARTGHSLQAFFATLGTPNAPTAAVLYCATGPGLARRLLRVIADMIVGPLGTTFGVARSVSVDCAFRTHAHVLVWSYWPSVRYCGMNCPTDRREPSI